MLFFVSKFNKLLFSIFIIYLNISNIIIGHIFIHWGYSDANIGPRIGVAAISPEHETMEYLMTYIDYRDILLCTYTFLILLLLYKFLVHFKHSFKIMKFLGLIIATAMISAVSFHSNPLTIIEPFSIPYKFTKAMEYDKYYDLRTKYLNSQKKISLIDKNLIYDKIIVIQGESVNKHHMSIYNYDKNTTPFLTFLKSKDNFYVFNAIAPSNLTEYSIPIFYSKANVNNFAKLFTHSRSIVGDFKNHKYKTYWISNQGAAGKGNTSIGSIATEANIYYFVNLDHKNAKPDEVLLHYLDNIKGNSNKEMYLIHLMGSHSKYTKRYTNNFVLFESASNIIEEYDNTIYYTDHILKEIFTYFTEKFSNKKLLFVYISDHGDVISEEKFGHGFLPPFKDEYDVPFVIYSSIENDRLDKLYQENKKRYFNLENLNYMIEYVSGLSDDNNISYSSDVFAIDPKNIFDYNKLKFYKQ